MKKTYTHAGRITCLSEATKSAGCYMLIGEEMEMIGCYTLHILKDELARVRIVNTYTLSEIVYG